MTDRSASISVGLMNQTKDVDGYTLDMKIQDYINRLALNCMGEEYAYQHKKKLEKI